MIRRHGLAVGRRKRRTSSILWLTACLLGVSACGKVVGARFDEAHLRNDDPGSGGAGASRPLEGVAGTNADAGRSGMSGAGAGEDPGEGGAGGQPVTFCPEAVDVEVMPEPADGRPSAEFLTRSLAIVEESLMHPRCAGVLLTGSTFVTLSCRPEVGELVSFRSQINGATPNEPAPLVAHRVEGVEVLPIGAFDDGTSFVRAFADWQGYERLAAWSVRQPYSGEIVTAVTYRGDGLARGVQLELPKGVFEEDESNNSGPVADSFIFGEDSKLIGFCAFDDCFQPIKCRSTRILLESVGRYIYAAQDAQFADYTGDGAADAAQDVGNVVNFSPSTGSGLDVMAFANRAVGLPSEFEHSILLGDYTGDGLADMAIFNDEEVLVSVFDGNRFEKSAQWLGSGFAGYWTRPFTGNVDGQHGSDLVLVSDFHVEVAFSTGSSFNGPSVWNKDLPEGFEKAELADVTGDGLPDLIMLAGGQIQVLRSTGTSFANAENWLLADTPGAPGWFFHDVTGDGKADAILLTRAQFAVFPSDGQRFTTPLEPWASPPRLGDRSNTFADLNGDGRADAVVVDDYRFEVYPSKGNDFGPAELWAAYPIWGYH